MADEIGGYFARLRLIVDQEDFNKGVRSLSMLTMEVKQTSDKTVTAKDSWKDFMEGLASSIYVIKNVAAALKDMYGAMADTNKQTFAISNAAAGMGMGTRETMTMLNAGNIAGINEKTMLASLQDMSGKMGAIMTGKLSVEQGTAMGVLGLGIDTEKDKKAPAILSDIVNAALKQARALDPDERDYQSKLESKRVWATQAGGDTAGMFFDYLMNPNSSIHSMGALLAAGAESTTLQEGGRPGAKNAVRGAVGFSEDSSKLGNVAAGYGKDIAGDSGAALMGLVEKLTGWLKLNEPGIENVISRLTDGLKGLADLIALLFPAPTKEQIAGQKAEKAANDDLRSIDINTSIITAASVKKLASNPKVAQQWYEDKKASGQGFSASQIALEGLYEELDSKSVLTEALKKSSSAASKLYNPFTASGLSDFPLPNSVPKPPPTKATIHVSFSLDDNRAAMAASSPDAVLKPMNNVGPGR
jgi:hypothetical protein